MPEKHNEPTPSGEETGIEDLIRSNEISTYSAQDWADVIIDKLGTDHSSDSRLSQDAQWWAADDSARYSLSRRDTYRGAGAKPVRHYDLKVVTLDAGSNGVVYTCWAGDTVAKRSDRQHTALNARKGRQLYGELLDHLRTAPVDPYRSFAAPRVFNELFGAIHSKEFNRRYRTARFFRKLFSREVEIEGGL